MTSAFSRFEAPVAVRSCVRACVRTTFVRQRFVQSSTTNNIFLAQAAEQKKATSKRTDEGRRRKNGPRAFSFLFLFYLGSFSVQEYRRNVAQSCNWDHLTTTGLSLTRKMSLSLQPRFCRPFFLLPATAADQLAAGPVLDRPQYNKSLHSHTGIYFKLHLYSW